MTLKPAALGVLDAVAEAIVHGRAFRDDDLHYQFHDGFNRNKEQILEALTERVLHHSHGRWTVRRADSDLFHEGGAKGPELRLVRCPASTPDGVVTELIERMALIEFGPYGNGYQFDVKRASEGLIRSRRRQQAAADLRKQEEAAAEDLRKESEAIAEAATDAFMDSLRTALLRRLRSGQNVDLFKQTQHFNKLDTGKQLMAIIGICAKLDITIQELVLDTVS